VPESFHGVVLTAEELEMAKVALVSASHLKDRLLVPGLDPKRADIIVAGALVLDAITQQSGVSQWTISLSALREGIVIDTLLRQGQWLRGNPQDVRWRSVRHFAQKTHVDEPHAWHITTLAVSLFDQLQDSHAMKPEWREFLRCGAFLHECGRFLGFTGHHKHAHYLVRNSNLLGFTEKEMEAIAAIIRYHRKRGPRDNDDILANFDANERKTIERLSSILRLAASLDRGRLGKIQELRLNRKSKSCVLSLYLHGAVDAFLELYEASLEKQHFEKAFGLTLDLDVAKFARPP
jgi:exopolyphosphatase/guanosine-5'-triphosphate,3'-diphosphate pyrophosphatase